MFVELKESVPFTVTVTKVNFLTYHNYHHRRKDLTGEAPVVDVVPSTPDPTHKVPRVVPGPCPLVSPSGCGMTQPSRCPAQGHV